MKIKVVAKSNGQYLVKVVAGNGEALVWSEMYKSHDSAMHCVELLKEGVAGAPVVDETEE